MCHFFPESALIINRFLANCVVVHFKARTRAGAYTARVTATGLLTAPLRRLYRRAQPSAIPERTAAAAATIRGLRFDRS